jgi:4-hydroxyphenylacetate 3-monooxygenase oxygenase component
MSPRCGQDYISGLQNAPRDVFVQGRRVRDVTQDPVFEGPIRSIAQLYDLQVSPAHRGDMTFAIDDEFNDENMVAGIAYKIPRRADDLVRRRRAIQTWAEASFGMVGRSPDFLNTVLMSWAESAEFFGQNDKAFEGNVRAYYRHCRDNDLFLTHAIVNPQADRSKPSYEQDSEFTHLGVVRETSEGLIVRGAKMLATHGPTADELLVYPVPGLRPGEERYALAFGIPTSTPGLRFICREPFDDGRQSQWDHPLGARFEEPDAVCVFDDVLIPWNRVFLYNDVALCNQLYREASIRNYGGHQSAIRGLVKTRFMTGLAIALARAVKTDVFLHVQEQLGEILTYVELIEAGILTAELRAEPTGRGAIRPAYEPLQALRYQLPKWYEQMVRVTQVLGAGGLLLNPTEADLCSDIGPAIDRYYRGAGVDARARTQLFKLAWDATGTQFGQRMLQYERYYAGDPVRVGAGYYTSYDVAPLLAAIQSAMELPHS